jgi:hypothetical protein
MSVIGTNLATRGRILAFAAIVECATGFALMVDPAIVVTLLVGAEVSGAGMMIGRCFGIALVALALACWPSSRRAAEVSPAFRAMVVYNLLITLNLVYLGAIGGWEGLLLWPAVALHAAVALLLVLTWRLERGAPL